MPLATPHGAINSYKFDSIYSMHSLTNNNIILKKKNNFCYIQFNFLNIIFPTRFDPSCINFLVESH